MTYSITWEGRSQMSIVYSGNTGAHEVLEVVRSQHGDARFDFLRKVLHDFSDIESCDFDATTLQELDAMGAGASFTNPNFRIAVVTTRKDVMDMVEEFMKEGMNSYPMQIFPTVEKARVWLEK